MNSHSESNTKETDELLAQQYVLGMLNAKEKALFEKQLQLSPHLQKNVNIWQSRLINITDQLEEIPAPQPLSARIERSLDSLEIQSQKTVKNHNKSAINFWSQLSVWRGLAALFMGATLFLGLKLQTIEPGLTKPTYIAVLVKPETKQPGWVIQASQIGNKKAIQLVPLGLIDIPEGKALQFWTKADGWDKPISLGLVKKGEPLKIDINQLPALTENQLFEFTLEQETGSPTGLPTGPIKSIGRGMITL